MKRNLLELLRKGLIFSLMLFLLGGCQNQDASDDFFETVEMENEVESVSDDDEIKELVVFYHQPLSEELIETLELISPINEEIITYDELRHVIVTHYDFNDEVRQGELIVHEQVADEIVEIFQEVFAAKYPIEKIRLVSDYQNDDDLSMADNNTSAFNFRPVTGGGSLSHHAYGLAIDINPKYNPYVSASAVYPVDGTPYVNREDEVKGMIKEGDALFNAFTSRGWTWGGYWNGIKDYQHFEKNI